MRSPEILPVADVPWALGEGREGRTGPHEPCGLAGAAAVAKRHSDCFFETGRLRLSLGGIARVGFCV